MIYSPMIQKAITFATSIHRTQKRKGSSTPYITHPLGVGLILARTQGSEDVVIAGIHHDTIEDCEPYGSISKEYIAKLFNSNIANIVADLTEEDKTLPWMERKLAALKHIPHMSHDSLLVKSGDVLHNLSDLIADIEDKGLKVYDKFNASKSDTLTRYLKLLDALTKAWPENPLLGDISQGVNKLIILSKNDD